MMNIFKSKKIYKYIFFLIIFINVGYIFIAQQKSLDSYSNRKDYYLSQLSEQQKIKENLEELKNNINSNEYIEQMAREKLDMYLPNERVYIDKNVY